MTVIVDELRVYPNAKHRCFREGSAHLMTDSDDLDELHAFGDEIRIVVVKTGRRPFGDRRMVYTGPHTYEREVMLPSGTSEDEKR